MKRLIIIFFILILSANGIAQSKDSSKRSNISLDYMFGIIYAHHEDFKYFIEDYVQGFEINYSLRTQSKKIWQQIYNYPETGFGYTYINFGNPEILGSANAVFTFINVPLIEKKNCVLSSKFAVGISYLNNPFDLYNNNYNIAIGSHINAYLNINFDFKIRIYKQWMLLSGFGLTHFSNGGTTKPNKGLNLFLSSMGVSYNFGKKNFEKPRFTTPSFIKNYELSIIYALGFTSLEAANSQKYFTSGFSVNFERQYSYKRRYGLGLDLFYDGTLNDHIPGSMEKPQVSGIKDLMYAGGHISYDFVFGKTSFTIQVGAYFFQGQKFSEELYNRFGLKYRFAEHWIANLTLKTYWAKAKFPEIGIGYRIKW